MEEDFALAHDQVKYPIHTEPIDDAFKEANIEISFPQRDGHLDQIGLLSVRVLEKQGKKN